MKHNRYTLLLAILLFVCTQSISARICYASSNANLEYKLKAAFIYNFIKFTTWPNTLHEIETDNPLIICVVGENPFSGALEPLAKKQVADHQIVLSHAASVEDLLPLADLHVLFIDARCDVATIVDAVAHKKVLTISDSVGFAELGGCIELRELNGKLRFIINRSAVKKQGLDLSYQVYNLALEVVGDKHDI